jgi:hypothetical protein
MKTTHPHIPVRIGSGVAGPAPVASPFTATDQVAEAAASKRFATVAARAALAGAVLVCIDGDDGRPLYVLTAGATTQALRDLSSVEAALTRRLDSFMNQGHRTSSAAEDARYTEPAEQRAGTVLARPGAILHVAPDGGYVVAHEDARRRFGNVHLLAGNVSELAARKEGFV